MSGGCNAVGGKSAITQPELARYLDFSSELLSLTGKVGALYVQHFDDPVVLDAVNEVESLTTGLSRKIWQKIMLLGSAAPRGMAYLCGCVRTDIY